MGILECYFSDASKARNVELVNKKPIYFSRIKTGR
jgi:hypothetical protein